jgi:cytochrome c556
MSPRRVVVALASIGVLSTALCVQAAPPTKAEQVLKYRKSVYQVMAFNFGPLAAMSQGKMPYDAKEFAMRAGRVAMVAPLLTEAYSTETKGVAGSKLKPAMWDNRADFDAKLKNLIDKTAALATTAKAGDFETSKAAFFEAGGACKSCHDKYRED